MDDKKQVFTIYKGHTYVLKIRDDGYRIYAKIISIDGNKLIDPKEYLWAEYKYCDDNVLASIMSKYLMSR